MRTRFWCTTTVTAVAAVAMLSAGCFLFPGGGRTTRGSGGSSSSGGGGGGASSSSRGSMADVDAAKAKGDVDKLSQICMGRGQIVVLNAGCDAAVEILEQRKDLATLNSICKASPSDKTHGRWRNRNKACKAKGRLKDALWQAELGDCAKVGTIYKRFRGALWSGGKRRARAKLFKLALANAKCGNWDHIFVKFVHLGAHGGASGSMILKHLAENGHDIVAEAQKYLQANKNTPFQFKYGGHATKQLVRYLIKAGKTDNCRQWLSYAKKFKSGSQYHWIRFFGETKCKPAIKFVVSQLSSESSGRRAFACYVLGKIGTKRQIRKMRILARSDSAYKIVRLNKIYTVRDACRAAIGKIRLRN